MVLAVDLEAEQLVVEAVEGVEVEVEVDQFLHKAIWI